MLVKAVIVLVKDVIVLVKATSILVKAVNVLGKFMSLLVVKGLESAPRIHGKASPECESACGGCENTCMGRGSA
jgi:hypothetical protein